MLDVSLIGAERTKEWMATVPARLTASLLAATIRGTEELGQAVQAASPSLTGALRESIQTSVHATLTGASGRVYSRLRYAPYVEFGSIHGAAQHMFARGEASVNREVERTFTDATREALAG